MADIKKKVEQFEYKAEMKKLLDLIIHSLYTHPEVFLRELISNASDALNKVRVKELTDKDVVDAKSELKITINTDSKDSSFSIEDTGIGMTKEELVNNIGTIAHSGTLEFLETMKKDQQSLKEDLIGKFGVGFYSVFMVTHEVTVETRHADKDSKGLVWKSNGEGTFSIEESDKQTRGTKISFKLKEEFKDFTEGYKIKATIEKYSNFADFPIFLGKDKLNKVEALWRKNAKELKEDEVNEFYKFVTNEFEEPLSYLPISVEGAVISFKALLFIPKTAPYDLFRVQTDKSVHLYSNKILIQRDCKDVLPEYLRFIRGVVDTIDLPLNVSREITQSSPVMTKIKNILVTKIFAYLEKLDNKEPEKYLMFYKNFGSMLKMGINSDFENRDKIINLLKFVTTKTDGDKMISLKEYVKRMKPNQKEIYYISGDSREAIMRNPNLEYFKKNDIEVLLLSEPADVFTVPAIGEYDKKQLKSTDKSDIDLGSEDQLDKPDSKLTKSLIDVFKKTLKDKVSDVVESKRLVDSAVTLVAGKDGMDSQMEKIMKAMNKDFGATSKKILEVNMSHPLMENIAALYLGNSKDPRITKCILQLYDGALFVEGNLQTDTDFVKRMTELMVDATKL